MTTDRFFDVEAECPEDFPYALLDLSGDRPLSELDMQPLRTLTGLPPVSEQYLHSAAYLEAMESGQRFDASGRPSVSAADRGGVS